jgi:Zn-dependent protease/CBS domain-containing protein
MVPRPGSIKLFEAFGIRIGVDRSWFLLLFIIIFLVSGSFRSSLQSSDGVAYATTVVTVLLFYGSLILHELGHALVARREGIEVKRIDLFLFGGLTQMSRDTSSPGEEFRIAIAGPLATLACVLVCLVVDLAIVGPQRLLHAVELTPGIHITPVLLSLSWLLSINVLILAFNLVPAFPLDGGRIARAIVWARSGEKTTGTRIAAKLGQGFAVLLAALGLAWVIASRNFLGLWLVAIAFLIWQSARGALMQTALTQRIEGVRVADIMDPQPVAIPADKPVGEALDEYFQRYGWSWFPVIDAAGLFLGIARQETVEAAVTGNESWTTVGSAVESGSAGSWRVDEDRPITELIASEPLGRFGALMAVDREGVLRGVITVGQVRRALQAAFSSPLG